MLNLNERVLSVLAEQVCQRYRDRPAVYRFKGDDCSAEHWHCGGGKSDEAKYGKLKAAGPHRVPKEMGILRVVDSGTEFNMDSLLQRIKENQERLEERERGKGEEEDGHQES